MQNERTGNSYALLANRSQYINTQRSEPPQLPDPTPPPAARRVVRSIQNKASTPTAVAVRGKTDWNLGEELSRVAWIFVGGFH